ncbi:histidine kinase [Chitinophaga sedimenti]|uniref:histidine kinase n=1 Tax=Chitinophaga sedimenti TaxID=2033606 RepID=UPI0027DF3BA9|nr:histidine kinase [Chitinophaga sedimenti]
MLIIVITLQQAIVEYQFMGHMMKRPRVGVSLTAGPGGAVLVHAADSVQGGETFFHRRDSGRRFHRTQRFGWRNGPPPPDSMMNLRLFPAEGDNVFVEFIVPQVLRRTVMFTFLMLFMSGFIKIGIEWFKSEKQREELKVANLNAELKFLKNQINPHFLFNCLNTIYSLAHKQSPETEHAPGETVYHHALHDLPGE